MIDITQIPQQVVTVIVGCVITAVFSMVVAFFNNIRKCNNINRKRLWRIEKTLAIMAKIIDTQTDKVHPELSSQLNDFVQEMLGDEVRS